MSVQVFTNRDEIQAVLPGLKVATVPGSSNDGARLVVTYHAFNPPTARSLEESELARQEHLDQHQFSGSLDRVFRNAKSELCFCILCLERTNADGRHCYRTFNTVRGDVKQIVLLDNDGNDHHDNGHPNKPQEH
jgi:hypothetical protein